MTISYKKIIWFLLCVSISGYISYVAYHTPVKFIPLVDLLATILSILIGLSLAISAILSSRPSINQTRYNYDEQKRLEKTVRLADLMLIESQTIIFWFYYISLILAVILKFVSANMTPEELNFLVEKELYIRILTAAFSFVTTLSLLWSATLPSLLRGINMQRKGLE